MLPHLNLFLSQVLLFPVFWSTRHQTAIFSNVHTCPTIVIHQLFAMNWSHFYFLFEIVLPMQKGDIAWLALVTRFYVCMLSYISKVGIWMTCYLDFISSSLHVTWGFQTEIVLTVQCLKAFPLTSSFCLSVLTLLSTSTAVTLTAFLGAWFACHQLKHRKNKQVSFTSCLFSSLVLGHVLVALLLVHNSFSI